MTSTSSDGCQPRTPPREEDETFHAYMRRLYRMQSPITPKGVRDFASHLPLENMNVVQARLPDALLSDFYSFLKAKHWSKTTGIQYAIYKLLNEKN